MSADAPTTQHHDADGRNVPVPDPSILTTEALDRAVFGLRELIEVKLGSLGDNAALNRRVLETRLDDMDRATVALKAVLDERLEARVGAEVKSTDLTRAIIETRLDGMDKAIRLLQDTADKFPARIDEKITALQAVHSEKFAALIDATDEKFRSIQTQFAERDVRTEQAAGAVKIAVDAALQAQKEAAGEQNRSNTLAQTKSETATTKQIDQIGTLIQNNTKSFDDKINDVKDRVNRIEGSGEGGKAMWGYVAGAIALAASLYFGLNHTTPAAPTPQVILMPSPIIAPPTTTTTTTIPAPR